MRLPVALEPLRDRPFRLLLTGQVISLLGDGMAPLAIAFAVLELTHSAVDLGFVLAAQRGPMVLLLLFAGVLADRVPRRFLMVLADTVRFGTQAATAALVLTGKGSLWELIVLQAIYGAATAAFYPAITGIMPSTVRAERLQRANALRSMAQSTGQVVGPAVAGAIAALASPGWALVADALTFAVDAYFLLRLPRITAAVIPGTFLRQLLDGWRAFTERSWIWTIVLSASVGNMLFSAVQVLGPFVAVHRLGGPGGWGFILALLGLGSIIGGVLALRLKPRYPLRLAAIVVTAFCLPPLALASGLSIAGVAASFFVASIGLSLFNVLWETSLQQHVRPELLSRVSAYDWFGSLIGSPAGAAVSGPLSAVIGIPTTLLISGGGILLFSLATLAVPGVRNLRSLSSLSAAGPREAPQR